MTPLLCVGTPDHSPGGALQPVAGDHYTVRQAASTGEETETRSADQCDSGHYSVGRHPGPLVETHDALAEDSSPMGTAGVVRLLRPTRVPSGYQKMIRARIEGRVEGALWMFEPVTQDSPCQYWIGKAVPARP